MELIWRILIKQYFHILNWPIQQMSLSRIRSTDLYVNKQVFYGGNYASNTIKDKFLIIHSEIFRW